MAFGKRQTPPGSGSMKEPSRPVVGSGGDVAETVDMRGAITPTSETAPPSTSPVQLDRLVALRDDLAAINTQASQLADGIAQRGPMPMHDAQLEVEPTRFPISIFQFQRHFNHVVDGHLKHSVYSVAHPAEPSNLRPILQIALFDMTSAVMHVNTQYLLAAKDNALAIAMQSPMLIANLDGCIVRSGVLGTLIDTMIQVQPQFEAFVRGEPHDFHFDLQKERLTRAVARARASILRPETLQSHMPQLNWPMLAIETAMDDHPGQIVIGEIYFPAQYATPMLEQAARKQGDGPMRRSA